MPIQQILEDIFSKTSMDPGGTTKEWPGTNATDVSPESLVAALERECNSRYKDTGDGLHFVGLLLTVFAAELFLRIGRGMRKSELSSVIVVLRGWFLLCTRRI